MRWLLQFHNSKGQTPLRWSGDSSLFAVLYEEEVSRLCVLNASLETIIAWPLHSHRAWPVHMAFDWTPSCILMAAVHTPSSPARLEVCWHPCQPSLGDMPETGMATRLLARLDPREATVCLAWGPSGGLALVTHIERQPQRKLYVLLPRGQPVSAGVHFSRFASEAALVWSPAGDRLLVNCPGRLQLFTSSCDPVLDMPHGKCVPVFSACGRHVAAAEFFSAQQRGRLRVRVFEARSGALLWEHKGRLAVGGGAVSSGNLAFSPMGDQLFVSGLLEYGTYGIHAFSFGRAYMAGRLSSRQLCEALAGVCSWANRLVPGEDLSLYDDPGFL